jgi:transcriptional regulator with XRE-family HTH domain
MAECDGLDPKLVIWKLLPLHPQPQPLESLSSYLIRLGEANGLRSLQELDVLVGAPPIGPGARLAPDYPAAAYGGLAQLSGCPETRLKSATFLHLGQRFGRAQHPLTLRRFLQGSLASCVRFCPQCLAEQSTPYHSLAWRFLALPGCVTHGLALLDSCGHCGSALPLLPRTPRIACCPACGSDVRAAEAARLPMEAVQITEQRTRDLEFLLSCHAPGARDTSALEAGKQFEARRQQMGLTITEAAQRMGGEEQVVLEIEYGSLYKKATFDEYLRYADVLGCSLQEIFTADRVQAPRSPRRVSEDEGVSEEQILTQVQEAIQRLQAQGLPVLPRRISVLVGRSVRDMRQYPRVKTLLNRHKLERSRQTVRLDHQREEELVRRVEQAIKQVEFLGKPLTQRRVCAMAGMTYSWLIQYPRVKAILLQIASTRPENVARRLHHEEQQLLEQAEHVIRQLESWGEPISQGRVCELMGISRERLRTHPRLKALVDQARGNSPESRQHAREREAELVKLVKGVIAQVASRGEPVTQWRVCKSFGLPQRYLERYPHVKALLAQCQGKRTRSRLRAERQEQELLERMEQAIKELEAAGEPVVPRAVGMMIQLPFQRLDDYPRLKTRLQQILDEEVRKQEWQKQQREEEFAQRLQQVISARKVQGKAITPNALLKITRLSKTEARRYPRVQTILAQYATNAG